MSTKHGPNRPVDPGSAADAAPAAAADVDVAAPAAVVAAAADAVRAGKKPNFDCCSSIKSQSRATTQDGPDTFVFQEKVWLDADHNLTKSARRNKNGRNARMRNALSEYNVS